ncbi:hypothetical protein [Streptomyces sp. NPDC088350]|uniref:hypothetical protein n=1 Tax=Streptomyces sp. NPDC088350 TaxID=3365854 RepID=UPI0038059CA1
MVTTRLHRTDLPAATRGAVVACTGPVYAATTADECLNSEVAVTLDTAAGRVFAKGLRSHHPSVWTQQRGVALNPHVTPLSPRLLCKVDDGD